MVRFENWQAPVMEHGKLTKWNWMVYNPENLQLGTRVDIGAFTFINAKYGITLEDEVQIGSHCSLYSVSTIDDKQAPITVKRNARIGAHCVVMPGVTIGENAIIGANSFVNKDVPANCTAFGTPIKIKESKKVTTTGQTNAPLANEFIPITKPTLPSFEELKPELENLFSTGMITNHKHVKKFEETLQNYLGVKHVIAMSSCTSGLMLAMKAMGLKGEVILPSFTFSATGHAAMWNGLTPKFVDIDPKTFQIDVQKVKEAITPSTCAIIGVHLFGAPAPVEELEAIAEEHNLKLIFDAAHAMGSIRMGKHIGGFGDVEVFSCSPTKLMVTAEGGIVATNNDEIARKMRIGRNYGDPGNYDCEFTGLNARMGEFNALLGLKSLEMLDKNIRRRNELVKVYKRELSNLPGLRFQEIPLTDRTTYKDFSILITPEEFGLDREELLKELKEKNIHSKRYFYPPLHLQRAYAAFKEHYDPILPVTNFVTHNILSLPLYSHMSEEDVLRVCNAVKGIRMKKRM